MSDDSVPKGPVENPRWIERRCTCHSAEEWEGNDWENLHPGPGGKRNTPREHIFQPGHKKSKGPRKKKDNGIASLFKTQADKVISAKVGGKSAKLTQAEYIVAQYWQDAIVRRQNIWHNSRRKLAECGPRPGVDIKRRSCGGASGDVRWSSV